MFTQMSHCVQRSLLPGECVAWWLFGCHADSTPAPVQPPPYPVLAMPYKHSPPNTPGAALLSNSGSIHGALITAHHPSSDILMSVCHRCNDQEANPCIYPSPIPAAREAQPGGQRQGQWMAIIGMETLSPVIHWEWEKLGIPKSSRGEGLFGEKKVNITPGMKGKYPQTAAC